MLKIEEIMQFIQDDATSEKKTAAKIGQNYYEGKHDILNYRMFYFNDDGQPVEDKFRSNIKITHPFFTELVDQAVQYILSGNDGIIKSDDPELQAELDAYFNANEDFTAELAEVITGSMAKGYEYMYAYKNADDRLAFQCADCLGVVEVRAKDTDDNCAYVIYRYVDRIEKGRKLIHRIQVWDDKQTWFYVQKNDDKLELDDSEPINPKPHVIFTEGKSPDRYFEGFGFIPFFRLDNNKKQVSGLATIKDLIDDYDLMASSLSNNLVDFDTPIHVVKGFEGTLDEMIHNMKIKKHVGVPEGGGVERQVIDVPYQARQAKLELDEKNIYRFGMGLNTSGLKDTNATTNIAIKAAYSLLDLKATKFEIKLKQFLRKILKIVLAEINDKNGTDYQMSQIYFEFDHEVMSNAQENAQIELTQAQKQQVVINTLLSLADRMNNDLMVKELCAVLDLDYEEVKESFVDPAEETNNLLEAGGTLLNEPIEE